MEEWAYGTEVMEITPASYRILTAVEQPNDNEGALSAISLIRLIFDVKLLKRKAW